ncbi:DUF3667 domain-containing protein [Segatella copri]|uniref:DUF3667 domain-containing protein n=1 Tax=Segatella copri TaxID=165179 RepID=A0AA92V089_9BACT|nr:DUF3667 domain-containing protein [Segatella copri]RHA83735.1 DUF3667 domain-containing protein [Segatella copri]
MLKNKISLLIRRYQVYLERGKPIPANTKAVTRCKHCGTEYRGNYCPRCGQFHTAGIFGKWRMVKTFREASPIMSNAYMRTIFELLFRPGYMIRDYFRGHQVSYLGPLTTLLVSFSLLTLVTHTYEELTNTVEPEKKEVVSKKDSSGKEEKYIYQKWGVTITSKDDGRMDNGKMAALWRVLRGKLESDTTLFLFAIFPMYGLAARRAFRKVNFGSYPLMAGAHYMALVYLYTLFALLPLPVWTMVYYLVWTYRGIYGMTWLRTIRYMAFTACWVVLYLFLLLVALALLGIGIVYLINFLFFT